MRLNRASGVRVMTSGEYSGGETGHEPFRGANPEDGGDVAGHTDPYPAGSTDETGKPIRIVASTSRSSSR